MAETHSLQDIRQQAAIAAKVFIQRDYTNGTVCQFQTKFPSELETRRLKSSSVAGCHAVTWKCLWIQNSKDRTWFSLCFVIAAEQRSTSQQNSGRRPCPPDLGSPSEIDKQQFEETVRTLNNLYAEAEKLGGQSYLEGCLACLTAYTIFLCMETHYEKVLKKIGKYIQEQNDKIYAPRGLLLTDPIERGLRVVEITIFEDRSTGSGR
ncbi:golgin subfamily A member 7 isoform X1 [Anguilla rostrata]|uniref:golgin subfamily A member 7 isoform X1 n=1 Tax=Anguilla rostrata TaxID=7938 RepID=UPI0030CCB71F